MDRQRPRERIRRPRIDVRADCGTPCSWEADLVQQLVKGTVGYDDDYLGDYEEPLP